MSSRTAPRTFVLATAAILASTAASAYGPANVLIVTNAASPDSVRVGASYKRTRAVPLANQLALTGIPDANAAQTDSATYESAIRAPVLAKIAALEAAGGHIDAVVLTTGIPYILYERVIGATGEGIDVFNSVDSTLTLPEFDFAARLAIHRKYTFFYSFFDYNSDMRNTYYGNTTDYKGDATVTAIAPEFSSSIEYGYRLGEPAKYRMFLVTRLDGPDLKSILNLISRSRLADGKKNGGYPFVMQKGGYGGGQIQVDLDNTIAYLRAQNYSVLVNAPEEIIRPTTRVAGYFVTPFNRDWQVPDPTAPGQNTGERAFDKVQYAPGALNAVVWSFYTAQATGGIYELRRYPPSYLRISTAIEHGATGASGDVHEPFADAIARPNILYPSYVAGRTLAEAYYGSLRRSMWRTLVIGDPLAAPYK